MHTYTPKGGDLTLPVDHKKNWEQFSELVSENPCF